MVLLLTCHSFGAGKTVLLEQTLATLKDKFKIVVIEVDITTKPDANRFRKYPVPVIPTLFRAFLP